jgi:hypothetical protein
MNNRTAVHPSGGLVPLWVLVSFVAPCFPSPQVDFG